MELKLNDIFVPCSDEFHYSKQGLLALEIQKGFISEIAEQLDLTYLENEDGEGNLCFANNEQLRPAFRLFFSKIDVVNYLNDNLQKEDFNISIDKVLFPESAEHFWELGTVKDLNFD